MHTPNQQRIENLNYAAAGLMTAAGTHLLLCVATLPGLMSAPAAGYGEIAFKSAKVLWTLAGIGGAGFVGCHAAFLLGARSYQKARLAAFGALLLPLIATNGIVTAFALVPAAVVALALLRQPAYRAAFPDGEIAEVEAVNETEAEGYAPTSEEGNSARQPAWPSVG